MRKMNKGIMAVVMTVAMVITSMSATGKISRAADMSGTCGDDLTWVLDEEGTLTVSGTGEMTSTPWEIYDVKEVVINEGVTTITAYAFAFQEELERVYIADGLIEIHENAFKDCEKLVEIVIPDTVEEIEEYTFDNCSKLESIRLPLAMKEISSAIFSDCKSLSNIEIQNNITCICSSAFIGCESITNINIPESVIAIEGWAFWGCKSMKDITIPKGVTSIGDGVFTSCNGLENIIVDEENPVYDSRNACNAIIETDSNKLIAGCQETDIPDSVVEIAFLSFNDCDSLKSIMIPANTSYIEFGAFTDCSGLESIVVDEENVVYDSRNDCNAIVESESNILLVGCQMTVIPTDIVEIETGAFEGCTGLTNIQIPDSVTRIGIMTFKYCTRLADVTIPANVTSIGWDAFSYCSSLTNITVDAKNGVYDSRNDCNAIIETATNNLLKGCQNTVIPDSILSITDNAFAGCSELEEVKIPSGVTNIGSNAFGDCSSLISIEIPNSVTEIADYAFSWGEELTIYGYTGSCAESYAKKRYWLTFIALDLGEINPTIEPTTSPTIIPTAIPTVMPTVMPTVAPSSKPLTTSSNQPPTTAPVPIDSQPSPTSAPENSFVDSKGNTYEIIRKGSIEGKGTVSYACAKKNAKFVTIPAMVTINEVAYEVTTISNNAFAGNKKITRVTIGKNVTKIGKNAFKNCSSLKKVTVKTKKLSAIGKNAFKGVHKKVFFKVPAGKKKAYKKLWKAKTGYKKSMKIK